MSKKGWWQQMFDNKNPLFAEFGCGRGKFILEMAEKHPERNFIGFEGKGSIILRALEKTLNSNLYNVFFVYDFIIDINEYFADDELSGIYLNFSVPWPKRRQAHRRMTHANYLSGYKRVLKPGSCIEFKTDDDDLFSFSLNEFKNSGMGFIQATEDLHCTEYEARYVTTEYEEMFCNCGKKIHYCKVQV